MTDITHPETETSIAAKATMDIHEIQRILPHRYPFLLIDRVVDMTRRERIVAIKNVTINEPFFQGHFPNLPIMVKPPVTAEEPLHAELKAFLDAVRRRKTPGVPLEDGRRALSLALDVVDQIHRHGEKIDLEKLANR